MTLLSDLLSALVTAGYTFTDGISTTDELETNWVATTFDVDAEGVTRWTLDFNYYHDNVADARTLAGVLASYTAGAVVGPATSIYKGRLPVNGKHYSVLKQVYWEK